uniref:Uncharacterized protein n=1 Tax=Accipiter nisus TaxID=211598 RepID=A0A8B9NEA5_9AVES
MARSRAISEYTEAEDKSLRLGFLLIAAGLFSLLGLGCCWLRPALQERGGGSSANCTVLAVRQLGERFFCTFSCGTACRGTARYPCLQVLVRTSRSSAPALLHEDERQLRTNPKCVYIVYTYKYHTCYVCVYIRHVDILHVYAYSTYIHTPPPPCAAYHKTISIVLYIHTHMPYVYIFPQRAPALDYPCCCSLLCPAGSPGMPVGNQGETPAAGEEGLSAQTGTREVVALPVPEGEGLPRAAPRSARRNLNGGAAAGERAALKQKFPRCCFQS